MLRSRSRSKGAVLTFAMVPPVAIKNWSTINFSNKSLTTESLPIKDFSTKCLLNVNVSIEDLPTKSIPTKFIY